MEFDEKQMNTITGLVKKAQHEFVKSEDFTSAIKEATDSAASEAATKIVNQAITSKLKSFGNSLESKMAELIKAAVPERNEDEPDDNDTQGGDFEAKIRKSKLFRDLQKSHDGLTGQVEKGNTEREAIESAAFQKERNADLQTLATELKAIDPGVVVDALRSRVSRDDSGDLVVVTKDKDNVETVQTTREHVEAYLKARPFLIKASDGGGAGSGSGSGGGAGGGGEDEKITPEMMKDPATFARLRKEGKLKGVPAESASS